MNFLHEDVMLAIELKPVKRTFVAMLHQPAKQIAFLLAFAVIFMASIYTAGIACVAP
ncbi:hypothetical protein [Vogesella indigofera]|uniref:Uncharacterized protein n=1 Tax=Vogesella indigofera TaxID=45465 RepID=A0ABT5I0V4_VOGIN|nr:hypothetical protein [Vogesella indigofera]MDC7689809.1 hypothetical protein [Vogesella indigofera]